MKIWLRTGIFVFVCGIFLFTTGVLAGPPYITDDPEPVEYRHWEVYIASLMNHSDGLWNGTAPHVEVNYGAITNLQLHVIAPLEISAPTDGTTYYGYGDTELGIKYRFIEEKKYIPQVGVFPLLEVPTGDEKKGLGTGHLQAFLPVWLQKSWGKWTTYGGGGYWIHPGHGNRDWWYAGALLQRQVLSNLAVGGELYRETAQTTDSRPGTLFNLGAVYDLSDNHHLMFSAGHSLQGPSAFQFYLAFQFTFGPEEKGKEK